MEVSLIPIEYINHVWPQIEEYMNGAAKYTFGRFTAQDIYDGLMSKPQQLWIAFDKEDNQIYGAVVTQVHPYPRLTGLVMHFTGGKEIQKWKDPMLALLRKFAKDNGCTIIESYGRPGWERIFKNDGFKQQFMFYELPVEN